MLTFWGYNYLKSSCSLPEKLEAGQLAERDAVWKKRPVADLSSNNLFNHLCDLNLRAETWPDLTSHQNWQIALRGMLLSKWVPKATSVLKRLSHSGWCMLLTICNVFMWAINRENDGYFVVVVIVISYKWWLVTKYIYFFYNFIELKHKLTSQVVITSP